MTIKLSGELINTLNLLPNIELDAVVTYITELKQNRKKEIGKKYKKELIDLLSKIEKDGFREIHFIDYHGTEPNEVYLDSIETIEIL